MRVFNLPIFTILTVRCTHSTTEVGNETSSLQNADFAKKVIYVLGDPNDNLGERLGWDVDEAERLLARDQSLELSEKRYYNQLTPSKRTLITSVVSWRSLNHTGNRRLSPWTSSIRSNISP